jgi:hypothetical protein
VAESPLVVPVAQAFCANHAAASFDCAYGYSRSVGDVAIVPPCPKVVLVAHTERLDFVAASFDAASPHYPWSVRCISILVASPPAESPHVMLGAHAFCSDLTAASFNRAYGYPKSVGGIAIVLPRPKVVLVAQAVPRGLATASFDAASPHYPWSVRCISIVAPSPLVVFTAEAFCVDLATASFDCAYPRSVRGVAVVASGPKVMLGAQAFTARLGSPSFDATPTAIRYAQAAAGDDGAAS